MGEFVPREERQSTRGHPRFPLHGRTKGRINGVEEVCLVNIGPSGALVEHDYVIRPGATLDIQLTLAGREIKVRCRVAWSMVQRRERKPDGEEALIYHSELEFLDPAHEGRSSARGLNQIATVCSAGTTSSPKTCGYDHLALGDSFPETIVTLTGRLV
jgi:hypothetical protein